MMLSVWPSLSIAVPFGEYAGSLAATGREAWMGATAATGWKANPPEGVIRSSSVSSEWNFRDLERRVAIIVKPPVACVADPASQEVSDAGINDRLDQPPTHIACRNRV